MSVRYNEPATISAITTIYGIGAGVLALRARTGILKILERLIFLIPIGMVLFQGMIFVSMVSSENPPPPIVLGAVIFVSAIFAFFMVSDIKFLRAKEFGRIRRYKRHAIRLALAVSETVRAPLITFAPPLFGNMTFVVYFIGPFFLVPLIYFLAMPKWIKNGQPTG